VEVLTAVDAPRIRDLIANDEFFWLDLRTPDADALSTLGDVFDLHPAAMEDSEEWGQLPKVDDYGDHVLLVFFTAERVESANRPVEVHVYLSGSWVVTVRRGATPLDGLHSRLGGESPEDEDLVVYRLLDALADGWDPAIAELDARVDDVEVEVLEHPRQRQLTTIYWLKQEVGDLLRIAHRQSATVPEAIAAIHDLPNLARGSREWLNDLAGHCDSIASDLKRIAGDLGALTDTFFNANANRLNRLATFIAIGSAVFLVSTLVTSFFGMNFGYLVRGVNSAADFWLLGVGGLVVPVLAVIGLLYWRRRDWS
jgi:magnesium transporter